MACQHEKAKVLKSEINILTGMRRVEAECSRCGFSGVAIGVPGLLGTESVTWVRIEASEASKR